jgi:hypothetical protein
MPRFIQMLAVHEKVTLFLAQRAYNDFCSDAAVQARRPGPSVTMSSIDLGGISTHRAEHKRGVPFIEDSENFRPPMMIASSAPETRVPLLCDPHGSGETLRS